MPPREPQSRKPPPTDAPLGASPRNEIADSLERIMWRIDAGDPQVPLVARLRAAIEAEIDVLRK